MNRFDSRRSVKEKEEGKPGTIPMESRGWTSMQWLMTVRGVMELTFRLLNDHDWRGGIMWSNCLVRRGGWMFFC